MAKRLLVLGNKRYSSWSLRGWLTLRLAGVAFDEEIVDLGAPDAKARILQHNPAGLVPFLSDGEVQIGDSLAIGEYVNERYANGRLLPDGFTERAQARAVIAEMHAGFTALRTELPMDLGREPAPVEDLNGPVLRDVERVLSMWESMRTHNADQGEGLFGTLGLPDVMYLPVAARFFHYAIDMTSFPRAAAYCNHLMALPDYIAWRTEALLEAERPQYSRNG